MRGDPWRTASGNISLIFVKFQNGFKPKKKQNRLSLKIISTGRVVLGGALSSTPSAKSGNRICIPAAVFGRSQLLISIFQASKQRQGVLSSHLNAMCSYVLAVVLVSSAVEAVVNRSSRDECLPGCSEPMLCRSSFPLLTPFFAHTCSLSVPLAHGPG